MTSMDIFMLAFQVLGGLALFIFGMNIMSESLRVAAGHGLRTMLGKATSNRFYGLFSGTLLGSLIHSSATTVMIVGFINAGLMSLAQAVPPMLGANLGTSLSMQLVSFKLSDYCFVAIAIGFVISMVARTDRVRHLGKCLVGFGLLFLGMKIMGEAMAEHRETLKEYLKIIDGHTFGGRLMGVLIALGITAIIQSSGATIGMAFALSEAGVFTSLWQVYPIIVGAQIGTCATALLGSVGTSLDSRRAAVGNLLTNIINGGVSTFMAPLWIPLLMKSSDVVVRQAANAHTFLMIQSCVLFMPFVVPWAALLKKAFPARVPPPEPSYLKDELLDYPEKALAGMMQELCRISALTFQSFQTTIRVFFDESPKNLQLVNLNEGVINEIKATMREYVARLNQRRLSARQSLMAAYLLRSMTELERIGDHVVAINRITIRRHKDPVGRFEEDLMEQIRILYERAARVLKRLHLSYDVNRTNYVDQANAILEARKAYAAESKRIRDYIIQNVLSLRYPTAIGIYFLEYQTTIDRIVRHAKVVASTEKRAHYFLKPEKLEQPAEKAPEFQSPNRLNPDWFLEKIAWDENQETSTSAGETSSDR